MGCAAAVKLDGGGDERNMTRKVLVEWTDCAARALK